MKHLFATLLTACALVPRIARAADWPQFLGPTRNGVYAGNDLAKNWPADGPPLVWETAVGQGFSGPVVAAGKLVMFHRRDEKEIVDCLNARTGKPLWTFSYPTAYSDDFGFDEGPRATPSIASGRVFTYGAEGMLNCLDLTTGSNIWQVNAKAQFAAPKGFFGIACSPLAEGGNLLLNIGGVDGAGIVAFDQATGKVRWKIAPDEASYSSPVAATVNGHRTAFFFTRKGLTALDPADGKVQFEYPWRPRISSSVSAATPLIVDDLVFLSASYGAGAIVLRLKDHGVEKVWSADRLISNHYATSVCRDGLLFGIDGRTDPGFQPAASLCCVELKTGKPRWRKEDFGAASLTLAGDQLLILTERGELIRADASGTAFKPNARAQILPFQVRAFPAIADGLLYARSKDKLVCRNLGETRK